MQQLDFIEEIRLSLIAVPHVQAAFNGAYKGSKDVNHYLAKEAFIFARDMSRSLYLLILNNKNYLPVTAKSFNEFMVRNGYEPTYKNVITEA